MSVKKGMYQIAYDRPAHSETEHQEERTADTRSLMLKNSLAENAIDKVVEGVVGKGLVMQAKPDTARLNLTPKHASEWSKNVEAEFRAYCKTPFIDLEEILNLDQLAAVFFSEQLISGDGIALDYWQKRSRTKWRTCVRIIDSNLLRNPQGESEQENFHQGIKTDSLGRVICYNFRKVHQNSTLQNNENNQFENVEVRKYKGRRLKVYHGYYKRRPGSYRGIGALTSALSSFKCLAKYQKAELDAAVANALIAAVITSNASFTEVMDVLGAEAGDEQSSEKAWDSWLDSRPKNRKIETGKILNLIPGETFDSHTPGRPNSSYSEFVKNVIREIGVSLQVPYEVLMSDFSQSNYSSARAAFLQVWRSFSIRREHLVNAFYAPVYKNWLDEAISRGIVEAPGYFEDPTLWNASTWQSDGYGIIDPQKEAQAMETRLRNGSTMQKEFAETGQDWEGVLEQKAREKAKMKELGLNPADINPQLLGQGMQQETSEEEKS